MKFTLMHCHWTVGKRQIDGDLLNGTEQHLPIGLVKDFHFGKIGFF